MLRCLLLGAAVSSAAPPNGDAMRAAGFFDGLMAGLGTPVSSSNLPNSLSPRCGLRFDAADIELRTAISLCLGSSSQTVLDGLHALARTLKIFAAANYRCRLRAAGKIGQHVGTLLNLNASNIGEAGQILINDVEISGPIRRASNAIREERYHQAGLALALALVGSTADVVDDEPFDRDSWSNTDAHGRIRGEDELIMHWREKHERRLLQLQAAERRMAAAPRPRTLNSEDEAGAECCCCWAQLADENEAVAHAVHVHG